MKITLFWQIIRNVFERTGREFSESDFVRCELVGNSVSIEQYALVEGRLNVSDCIHTFCAVLSSLLIFIT